MKVSTVLIGLPSVVLATGGCNANNCARAITGTRSMAVSYETRQADCSNFMTTTLYTNPTATAAPAIVYNRKMKREVVTVTHTMPAYASPSCGGEAAYSSVCSCWGFPATTTIVATPTTTVYPQVTCHKGLEWAFWDLPAGTNKGQIPGSPGHDYDKIFKTDNIKGIEPKLTGEKAKQISFSSGGASADGCSSADLPIIDGVQYQGHHQDYSALMHRGYLKTLATEAVYTVTFAADDLALLWVGDGAISGWTVDSANAKNQYGQAATTYSFTAPANVQYPIRFLYVNSQGCNLLHFTLTGPDGTVYIQNGQDTSAADNVFTSGCTPPGASGFSAWAEDQ